MGFIFRRQIRTGSRSHLTISRAGVSESVKLSPRVTFNTREGFTIHLGKGLSFRTGKLF